MPKCVTSDYPIKKTSLNRGIAALPLSCPSHEKGTTQCTPSKWWWFVYTSITHYWNGAIGLTHSIRT